jgi:hypothetical protein
MNFLGHKKKTPNTPREYLLTKFIAKSQTLFIDQGSEYLLGQKSPYLRLWRHALPP